MAPKEATAKLSPPSVHFWFQKNFKAPASFKELNISDSVTATVRGKVISLSQREDSQSVEIEMETVEFLLSKPKNLKEAHRIAQRKAKEFE